MAGGGGDPMDLLPAAILADILGRVADASDLAACRLASRALLAASRHCPRVRLIRRRLRRRGGPHHNAPFSSVAANLTSLLADKLVSLSILAVDSPGPGSHSPAVSAAWGDEEEGEEFREGEDMYLTGGEAAARWIPQLAGGRLRELEIDDYWPQSCWRMSDALALISHHCNNLVKLVLRNAWLSVEGLTIMPNLIELTLEFIRLEDGNLNKFNECFASVQVLNLIGVGGLKDPKINLPQLKICYWEVSNIPRSLTIHAPNLVNLELKCSDQVLVLETPSMSTLDLTNRELGAVIKVEGHVSLSNLRIESMDLNCILGAFVRNRAIRTLELEIHDCLLLKKIILDDVLRTVASVDEVKLGPNFSCELQRYFGLCASSHPRCLRKLVIHLPPSEFQIEFVSFLSSICTLECELAMLFHVDYTDAIRRHIMSMCMANFPKIRWQWGTWRGRSKKTYIAWIQ